MIRPALLDVNVLVALFHPDHVHHEVAHDWFADNRPHGWATCPITENGCLRVLAALVRDGDPAESRPTSLAARLRQFCASGHHQFWPDSVSLRDERVVDAALIGGHRQLTDVYLLALATKMGGRLATFDRTIPMAAVAGATREALAIITAE